MAQTPDVCLINMPYAPVERPTLALGLIENYISNKGFSVETLYANLEFATIAGLDRYYSIESSNHEDLIGEWTFSRIAFDLKEDNAETFLRSLDYLTETSWQNLHTLREKAERFIVDLAEKIVAKKMKVVGCTSTFQQNTASIALLRAIKKLNPEIITLMGGANCEGPMGAALSKSCPWVDYTFSGECDEVIGDFIEQLINGVQFTHHNLPYGVITEKIIETDIITPSQCQQVPRATVEDMKKVAIPNYDSYFAALKDYELDKDITPGLLVETSRGCWWGAKRHCTFCGLNGSGMAHRAKEAEAVVNELDTLSSKYQNNKFEVVDNILPMEYMNTVLCRISDKNYSIFYETKANLRKEHIEVLAEAGVKWIQPGLESLQDDFLKLVKKGTNAIQNVATLKFARQSGIRVAWNLLYGAPGEQTSWYDEMAQWMPLISHVQPPQRKMGKIRYPRFSPYFNTPEEFDIELTPCPSYQFVYPHLDKQTIFDLAYFFIDQADEFPQTDSDHPDDQGQGQMGSYQTLQNIISDWNQQFWCEPTPPILNMVDHGDSIRIIDTRKVATKFSHVLTGLAAHIYRLCESPVAVKHLLEKINAEGANATESDISPIIEQLIEDKILLSVSHCYLSLALSGNIDMLPASVDYPGGYLSLNLDSIGWKIVDI